MSNMTHIARCELINKIEEEYLFHTTYDNHSTYITMLFKIATHSSVPLELQEAIDEQIKYILWDFEENYEFEETEEIIPEKTVKKRELVYRG